MDQLRTDIHKFVAEREWEQFHSPKNLAMALSVEVAEIVEHFQWLTEEQSHTLSRDNLEAIGAEIGDVQIYLIRLSYTLGLDPLQMAANKLKANEAKYPAEKVRGKALKYSEYRSPHS
jgi:dCTP diphosphatase